MEQKIEAAPVVRDAQGHYDHPDLPPFGEGDAASFRAWTEAQCLVVKSVWMEEDAPDLADRYFEGEGDPSALVDWQPTSPGLDWFLLALYEDEDGPVAWFASRSPAAT
ncbi:hypothetical protein [Janthinobacterium sp. J1-1]|uniref:hypothetical protein n=1 Tax=Janthinobacterium sp. J1-1 TaxID=3065910 RepID=UPI0028122C93|nr:hypothetical protein [Janthinobacterium sp. J1-1]